MKSNEVKDHIVKAFIDFAESKGIDRNTSDTEKFVNTVETVIDDFDTNEPEKVIISKTDSFRQDWLIARYGLYNPDAISDILTKYKDEAWDMIEAYVNGYTVRKESKWRVKVPDEWIGNTELWWRKEQDGGLTWGMLSNHLEEYKFTESELKAYHLDQFWKMKVPDGDD